MENDLGIYYYTGFFDKGITYKAVNCLNACDTPCNSTMGIVPIGTIFACDSGILPAGAMPLYIRRF